MSGVFVDTYGRFRPVVCQELLEDWYQFVERGAEFRIKLPTLSHYVIAIDEEKENCKQAEVTRDWEGGRGGGN